eukprot:363540-Chlamydomonas_euryale.AAC.3
MTTPLAEYSTILARPSSSACTGSASACVCDVITTSHSASAPLPSPLFLWRFGSPGRSPPGSVGSGSVLGSTPAACARARSTARLTRSSSRPRLRAPFASVMLIVVMPVGPEAATCAWCSPRLGGLVASDAVTPTPISGTPNGDSAAARRRAAAAMARAVSCTQARTHVKT